MTNEPPNPFAEAMSELESNQDNGIGAEYSNPTFVIETPESKPRPLWNGRKPLYSLKAERPEHRAIIMMTAAGMGNKEIADALGYSAQHVMYVKKQPWAVAQILEEIEKAGREPVMQLLRVSAMEATETILDTMRTADSKKVRLDAAGMVMDRVFGKATNKIEVTNKDPNEFTDEELAAIAARGQKN